MNMDANKVILLSFSGRKNGNCERIAQHIQSIAGGRILSFADLNVHPCGQCRYECFEHGERCPHFRDDLRSIYEAILQSDCAYYILPNYCDFPNAHFFAFNERSLCVFSGNEALLAAYGKIPKKFIVISGGEENNFRAALSQHSTNPEILFLCAKDFGQRSTDGALTESPEAIAKINSFMYKECSAT